MRCALHFDEPLVVPDATKDPRFFDNPLVTGPMGLRFYAGAPIVVAGVPVGTVCVIDTKPRRLSQAQIDSLAALARQTVSLLESRLAEKRSAAAERRFSAFMHHAPVAAFLKDGEGRMRYVNHRFEQLFGCDSNAVLGCLDSDWLPDFAADKIERHDAHVRETGAVLETCERISDVDGGVRDLSVLKFPVVMEDATWIGVVALDVTELREAKRTAQAERDFSEAVIGTGGALVCVLDREGRFVRFNAECERVTGRRATEILGLPFWVAVFPPEEHEAAQAKFLGLKPSDFPLASENLWLSQGGERRLIEWRSNALLNREGELEFVVGTGIDVTVRRAQDRLLRDQRRELREANARLERLATTDELTRVANRLAFRERLALELARAERDGTTLSLALLDVDRFKLFNDEFGHGAGDEALRNVARVLTEASRGLDLVARYGGEEFIVLMPGAEIDEALHIAERLRTAIESAEWPSRAVTVSIGVATVWAGGTGDSLVAEADAALYASKAAGRNLVTHAQSLPRARAA